MRLRAGSVGVWSRASLRLWVLRAASAATPVLRRACAARWASRSRTPIAVQRALNRWLASSRLGAAVLGSQTFRLPPSVQPPPPSLAG
jgi:hypothetical protein